MKEELKIIRILTSQNTTRIKNMYMMFYLLVYLELSIKLDVISKISNHYNSIKV